MTTELNRMRVKPIKRKPLVIIVKSNKENRDTLECMRAFLSRLKSLYRMFTIDWTKLEMIVRRQSVSSQRRSSITLPKPLVQLITNTTTSWAKTSPCTRSKSKKVRNKFKICFCVGAFFTISEKSKVDLLPSQFLTLKMWSIYIFGFVFLDPMESIKVMNSDNTKVSAVAAVSAII